MNTRMDVRFNGGKLNNVDELKEMCNDVMGSAFVGDKFETSGEHEKLKQDLGESQANVQTLTDKLSELQDQLDVALAARQASDKAHGEERSKREA